MAARPTTAKMNVLFHDEHRTLETATEAVLTVAVALFLLNPHVAVGPLASLACRQRVSFMVVQPTEANDVYKWQHCRPHPSFTFF